MAYPIPCPTSPFNWPADLSRYSYEHVSSICGVSADLIRFLDRGEFVDGTPEYLSERVELVNFTLKELAAGRRVGTIRKKLEHREWRAREAEERAFEREKEQALKQRLRELTKHGRKMGWLP